jgi:RNase P/RNase MRP subunit POP5
MSQIKKKLNVIRPTLRHKKRYFKLSYSKENHTNIYSLLSKNYEKSYGLFSLIESNLTVMDLNTDKKTIIVRINKDYKSLFLSSLFFLKQDLGLIFVLKEASTLKSLK